jgi:hypothetical protein
MRYLLTFSETDGNVIFSPVSSNCKKTIMRLAEELSEKYYVSVFDATLIDDDPYIYRNY